MVEDNGVTTNVQLETFDGSMANYRLWITYFKAILMIKNLKDFMKLEFESELPKTKTTEGQNTKQNKVVKRNKIAINYYGKALVSSQWPNGQSNWLRQKPMNGQVTVRTL